MANSNKGLKIGNYKITPLGLGVLVALVLVIAALAVILILDPFGTGTDVKQVSAGTVKSTPEASADIQPTATPKPTPTPAPVLKSATIRALGEIAMENDLLVSAYNPTDKTFDFSPMFTEIADVMGDADYTIADVEGAMGDTATPSGKAKSMLTPSQLISDLKDCGVDMLMLANEHMLDGGMDGLKGTIAKCEEYGMDYVGANTSADDRDLPIIKTINGIKVGFIAYTEGINGNEKTLKKNAYAVNSTSNSNPVTDIQNARIAGAEVIVAFCNWGEVGNRKPNAAQANIAKALCTAGADVIIGYNPHVVQQASWLEVNGKRTLCLCATGNFLSNQRAQYGDSGIIFEFTIQEQSDGTYAIENPKYIPTYVWRTERIDGGYDYKTLPVGDYVGEDVAQPDGMSYTDFSRMSAVWAEIQGVMESSPLTLSNR